MWCRAEANRMAGEIALPSPKPDAAKAQARISTALSMSRVNSKQNPGNSAQQWASRASGATRGSRSRLANYLLRSAAGLLKASTRDLKEAKALLEELAS
jgi:hypothetical protein